MSMTELVGGISPDFIAALNANFGALDSRTCRSVMEFGAKGDGVADDSDAIIAAINALPATNGSWGAGLVVAPPGFYKITKPLPPLGSFAALAGVVKQGTTFGFYGMANIDWVTVGSSLAATRFQKISDIGLVGVNGNSAVVAADGTVSGASIKVINTFSPNLDRVLINQTPCAVDVGPGNNGVTLRDIEAILSASGSLFGINWHAPGDGSARSDVFTVDNVVVDGSWSDAIGFNWRGFCNTLVGKGLRILRADQGLTVSNPAGSNAYYPQFLNISDLELDGFKTRALWIKGGNQFKITNSDISNTSGVSGQGAADSEAIKIEADLTGSVTRGVSLNQVRFGGCRKNGLYSDSYGLSVTDCVCAAASGTGSGSYAAIRIGADSRQAIVNGFTAEEFGGLAFVSYGVQVDNGATGVLLDNIAAAYAVTGPIHDLSGSAKTGQSTP